MGQGCENFDINTSTPAETPRIGNIEFYKLKPLEIIGESWFFNQCWLLLKVEDSSAVLLPSIVVKRLHPKMYEEFTVKNIFTE